MTAARTPRRPLLALAVVVLLLVGLVAAVLLAPYDPNVWQDPAGALAAICAFAGFGLVGALIIWHRPGNALGWLMFATLLAVLTMVSESFVEILENSEVLFAVSITLFPFAIAVAIFRYRLYDIDVIINRALVYGALTVSLVLVYLMGVAGVQTVFRLLTDQAQQPQLAVVASTLVIAALFNPLRRRIQATIDRRFYRRKYDARKTLDDFSIRLRDETDLQQLNADLLSVVRETMQPAHASLWLRSPERASGQEAKG